MFNSRRSDPTARQRTGRGANRSKRRGRAERVLPLALVLVLMVFAVPAAAKGPALYPSQCAPVVREDIKASPRIQTLCERRQTVADRRGVDRTDAGILAGSVALVVLLMAGGMLVAIHRRDADRTRTAALS
jgi:hypothetical protein